MKYDYLTSVQFVIVHNFILAYQGTKYVSGHKRVSAKTCRGTNVHVGMQGINVHVCALHDCNHTIIACQGTNVSVRKRVWEQTCLGTNVSWPNRVGLSMYGHKSMVLNPYHFPN